MKILISGTVQGVGFRPTVYRVANSLGLKGYVLNKGSNVEIGIADTAHNDAFLRALLQHLPPLAVIDKIKVIDAPVAGYDGFTIIKSSEGAKTSLTPVDTAICPDCFRELVDVDNRRYLYPFINCTTCGARFSVIENLPYDRSSTSMREFPMCEACREEYTDPRDRRFHAQTTSCPRCGPQFTLYHRTGDVLTEQNPIETFAQLVDEGALGIAKSWGGMHLIATFEAVPRLRQLYGRPAKPFAVMFRDLETVEKYAELDAYEESLLTSAQRPIVLLAKRSLSDELFTVSPGLSTVGVYLPYSGLHHVLFQYLKADGILMTSANIPGEPMVIRNEDAFKLEAEYLLLHNRRIVNRLDDSVIRCCGTANFFLRRSRGFVPVTFRVPYTSTVLSVGAMENVTASVSKGGRLYTTQYIGNTVHYPTVEYLATGTEQLLKLMGLASADIEAIALDLHPRYPTRRYARELADAHSIELVEVQHHWAHAASLMLDRSVDELVALTLDGTGYGVDGKVWGGEILHARYDSFSRLGSLEEVPLLGAEQAIKEPRRLVYAILTLLGREREASRFAGEKDAHILRKLLPKAPRTSSFGRVLDALSCYLGICDRMTYDGEPAMKLERYLGQGELRYDFETDVETCDRKIVRTLPLFDQLLAYQVRTEQDKADIAYSFLHALLTPMVEIAADACTRVGTTTVGLTGGVSYDLPIVRMVEGLVKAKGLTFLTHERIPNGDGGISAGQNVIAGHKI